jgi:hypothetical protein
MDLPELSWAAEILRLDPAERGDLALGPYFVHPETGRLMLPNEIRRRPRDRRRAFLEAPAPGWLTLDDRVRAWCPVGGQSIVTGRAFPRTVRVPAGDTRSVTPAEVMRLLSSGAAFVLDGDLYLLPEHEYEMNSFVYHLEDHEHPRSSLDSEATSATTTG